MSSELIFAGDGVDAGDVVDALMKVHSNEGVGRDQQVGPAKVPVTLLWLIRHLHSQTQRHLTHHWVVRNCIH